MKIEELTVNDLQLLKSISIDEEIEKRKHTFDKRETCRSFKAGEKVLIRTVTYTCAAEVVKEDDNFLYLTKYSWIANTGLFSNCVTGDAGGIYNDENSEVEPVGEEMIIRVNKSAFVDVFPWLHELPIKRKKCGSHEFY